MKGSTFAFMCGGAALMASCALLSKHIRPPEVKLHKASIERVSFEGLTVMTDLKITNSYPVKVPIPKLQYALAIAGHDFVAGTLEKLVTLPPANADNLDPSAVVSIPVALKFTDVYKLAKSLEAGADAPYEIKGAIFVDTPVGMLDVPFAHKGKFPVIKLPTLQMPEVSVKAITLSGAQLELAFKLHNPNKQSFGLERFGYQLALSGTQVAAGNLAEKLNLPAGGDSIARLGVEVGYADVGRAIQNILSGSQADYRLKGDLSVSTPWGALASPISASGTTRLVR